MVLESVLVSFFYRWLTSFPSIRVTSYTFVRSKSLRPDQVEGVEVRLHSGGQCQELEGLFLNHHICLGTDHPHTRTQ